MTYREIAQAISDFSKTISDDSIITIDHIIFTMSKYRNYILNSQFSTFKKEIGDSNYQTVCIELTPKDNTDLCGAQPVLVSTSKVPFTMTIGSNRVYPAAGFMFGNIQLVNNTRFKYLGDNRFLRNIIYATIGPDQHLYLKSGNEDFMYMPKVRMTALFTDIEQAAELECNENCDIDACDILDHRFPLDDSYLPMLMKLTVQDIVGAAWKPADQTNNAADDLASFAQILNRYTTQAFKNQMNSQNNMPDGQ